MKFARTQLPPRAGSDLSEMLACTSLDLLQLDLGTPVHQTLGRETNSGWGKFLQVLPLVYSAMYLRPELRVVTNAGRPNAIDGATLLAEYLVSRGSSDVSIAAIRGDNLLPYLDEILPNRCLAGTRSIVSARLEIGGGPFATAITEGASFIITGCYDVAAPLVGAAIANHWCTWRDTELLANLAAAAHFQSVAISLESDGAVELELTANQQIAEVRALGSVAHADVTVDFTKMSFEHTIRNTLRPRNVRGSSSSSVWNAGITVEGGFLAAAILAGNADKLVRLNEELSAEFSEGSLKYTEYHPVVRKSDDSEILVRIEYCDPQKEPCWEFVNWLESFFRDQPTVGQLVSPFPGVTSLTNIISVRVPADAVAIAVDTRPACEWL